jgi:hypothetical protein
VREFDQNLTEAPRCVVAAAGPRWPVAAWSPFWWDGANIWLPGSPAVEVVERLRRDSRACAYVPASRSGPAGQVLSGRARVYGLHDPVGLAIHGPAIAASLSAMALKLAPALLGYARDLPQISLRRWPAGFVVVRVSVEHRETAVPPEAGPGMGPALPSVVPPAVRRELSGLRDVVLAYANRATGEEPGSSPVGLVPAVWSAGFRLDAASVLPDDAPATVLVDDGHAGLALEGRVRDRELVAEHARWWQGLVVDGADVPQRAAGGIDLPE